MKVERKCKIVSKEQMGDAVYMVLEAGDMVRTSFRAPGQFVHVKCGEGLLLRRPISVCTCYSDEPSDLLTIVFEGTDCLARRPVGHSLDVLGLAGNGFTMKPEGRYLLVGGGIGIPPMLGCAQYTQGKSTAILGGGMALGGAITLGTVQAFLQYVNQIAEPVTEASYVITSLQAAIAGAERVFALLDEEEERPDAAGDASVITQGHVEFRHVRFGYTPERTLIHDLNLEVHPNEMVAIVGPTGGGKTTLVNLLMRFYELDGGSISIDGQDITALPRGELRRRIGMVLQDAWLFEGTIAENIAYGRRDATREEIVAAARAACCDHFIRTLPQGYDTPLSGETTGVSQGQMQLLTIARAMLTDPAILVLDEATAFTDPENEDKIQRSLMALSRGKTLLVIAHRLSTIQNADQIVVLEKGRIVDKGTQPELLSRCPLYQKLWQAHVGAQNWAVGKEA